MKLSAKQDLGKEPNRVAALTLLRRSNQPRAISQQMLSLRELPIVKTKTT